MTWMAWTWPTALFFGAVGLMLVGMTHYHIRHPSTARKGWLPLATTRGDRLYIGLLGCAFIHFFWFAITDLNVWGATALAAVWLAGVMRWG